MKNVKRNSLKTADAFIILFIIERSKASRETGRARIAVRMAGDSSEKLPGKNINCVPETEAG